MSDTTTDARRLIALQEADLVILRAKKHLGEMPEREKILSVKAKLAEIDVQADKVRDLRLKCDASLHRLQDEDSMQKDRADALQAQIDATTDYRSIQNLTRDLEGTAKRREKIEFELAGVLEKSDKIAAVEKQIGDARNILVEQEAALIKSFKANGVNLQRDIALGTQKRDAIRAELSPALLARYDRVGKSRGGIAVARLMGRRCSACRADYHDGQMAKLTGGPDVAECPSCHRILIVRGLDEGDEA